MQAVNRQPYRNSALAAWRAARFGTVLGKAATAFHLRRLQQNAPLSARQRADWLHDFSKLALRRIGVELITEGDPPLEGLVVSNHLSYLDVLVYSSLLPCLFVSKQEVSGWPVFGRFATMAGTLYVDREREAHNRAANLLMEVSDAYP